MWLAMNGSVDPATIGQSNEMYAIAAVVIGGISMSGGKGRLLGVLFGAMSYTIIDKIISSLGWTRSSTIPSRAPSCCWRYLYRSPSPPFAPSSSAPPAVPARAAVPPASAVGSK